MLLERSTLSSGELRSSESEGPAEQLAADTTELEVTSVDPLTDSRWDLWVQAHPAANFFHGSAWARVLNRTYGHRPHYLRIARTGTTLALVPLMEVSSRLTGLRGVCLPFSDACQPLLFRPGVSSAVLKEVTNVARERGWRHVEIRGPLGSDNEPPASAEYCAHSLDLQPGAGELFSNFDPAMRQAIRKAERNGVTTTISSSSQALLEFYRLHSLTRKHHGLPPQPIAFFLNIYEEVIKRGRGFLVSAMKDSQTLAANLYVRLGDRAIYKFGASDRDLQHLRASNLVMWKAIEFLANADVKSLHFGRTSPESDGLRRFKASWGASEQTLAYHQFDTKARAWTKVRDRASGIHNRVFSNLPLAVNRLAGALIYPHLD